jgi:hypothetical protein
MNKKQQKNLFYFPAWEWALSLPRRRGGGAKVFLVLCLQKKNRLFLIWDMHHVL